VIVDDGGDGITIIRRNNLGDKQAYDIKVKVHSKGNRQLHQSGLFKQSNIGHLFGALYLNPGDEKKLPCFFL
jgi:hypothetical protein